MTEIDGMRVLVAGGADRVGRAIALDLAERGADVVISYHSSDAAARKTVAMIEALGRRSGAHAADATASGEMAALVAWAAAELEGLDAYVHCPSGGFVPVRPEDAAEKLWDLALDSTAKGFFFAAQAARERMLPSGGVIVAITDVAGLQPWPMFAPHGAAKAALIHLVKTLALAWGRDGIRVCGVAPGPVLMPDGVAGDAEETALGRHGTPADVCHAVRFCLESEFATGQNVIVDGGRLLRP